MKIGHLENKVVTPAVGERKPGPATASPVPGKPTVEPSATVALSSTVTQLAAGSIESVFDTQKVQRISDAIRDGKFVVNPEAIADRLIANAQELVGKVGKR